MVPSLYELVRRGVQVINMSFGEINEDSISFSDGLAYGYLCSALGAAKKYDVALIAASGNNDKKGDSISKFDYPASDLAVISVGAIDLDGNRIKMRGTGSYTQRFETQMGDKYATGGAVDVMAFGTPIYSAFYRDHDWFSSEFDAILGDGKYCRDSADGYSGYGYCSGTSMATPVISGIVACQPLFRQCSG